MKPCYVIGSVRFSYNPYFSACFFSRNSVFLSQRISRNSVLVFSAKRTGLAYIFCPNSVFSPNKDTCIILPVLCWMHGVHLLQFWLLLFPSNLACVRWRPCDCIVSIRLAACVCSRPCDCIVSIRLAILFVCFLYANQNQWLSQVK